MCRNEPAALGNAKPCRLIRTAERHQPSNTAPDIYARPFHHSHFDLCTKEEQYYNSLS
jgi:hypothetical protein